MNFDKLNEGYVFDSVSGMIGKAVSVDLINNTITLTNGEEDVVANIADVTLLEKIGYIGTQEIHNHDLVITADGKTYEIVAVGEDKAQVYLLNKKLERIDTGEVIVRTDLQVLAPYVTLIGNINEFEPEEEIDFNIKAVRDMTGGEFNGYYYACNNAVEEEIDLIKVVFVGHHLLKEETYERITLSHVEFLEMVADGSLVDVNPQEIMNYATGLAYGKKSPSTATEEVDVEEFLEEDFAVEVDYCDECGEEVEECDCADW